MATEPTACPACHRMTPTIAGLCPHCGKAKPDGAVPTWVSPEAPRMKLGFFDVFDDLGPYVAVAVALGAIGLVAAVVLVTGSLLVLAACAIVLVLVLGMLAFDVLTGSGI